MTFADALVNAALAGTVIVCFYALGVLALHLQERGRK